MKNKTQSIGAETMHQRLSYADDLTNLTNWRMEELLPYLTGSQIVLDSGAGVGNYTQHLLKAGKKVVAADYDERFVEVLTERFKNQSVEIRQIDLTDRAQVNSLIKEKIDGIMCLDVLEHIEDDEKAIQLMYELLPKGGAIVILVPAHPSLYCKIDENVGHFRRYTKKEIEMKVGKFFQIENSFAFNSIGILGYFINGKIMRKKYYFNEGQKFFDKLVPFFRLIDKYIFRKQNGLSYIVVARKKK